MKVLTMSTLNYFSGSCLHCYQSEKLLKRTNQWHMLILKRYRNWVRLVCKKICFLLLLIYRNTHYLLMTVTASDSHTGLSHMVRLGRRRWIMTFPYWFCGTSFHTLSHPISSSLGILSQGTKITLLNFLLS